MITIVKRRKIRTYITNEELTSIRRKHIVDCAKHVFYEKGYHTTTMRELAKACDMAIGAIYNYIGSKDDILHLIIHDLEDHQEIIEPFYKGLGNISNREKLEACIVKYCQMMDNTQDMELILIREIKYFSKEDRAALASMTSFILSFFENLLNDGCKAGEFQIDDARLIAHTIYAVAHSWVRERAYLRKLYTVEEYARKQASLILNSIQKV